MAVGNAQDITDGLRYSTDATTGSARFHALSGAFGALGGDLSAIAINPAGSAIFLKNTGSVSFGVFDRENSATYFGNTNESIDTDVNINQAGVVFVFNNYVSEESESKWKKFTIGLNYNPTQNYDDELFIRGTGNTSISEFFLQQAQGIPLNLLELQSGESISDLYSFLGETEGTTAQNAFLGFQGFIFDPVDDDPNGTQYVSNIAPGSFNQEYAFFTNGYNGKYTINFAAQYTDNFFFGINLNSHVINYDQSTFLFESNSNPESIVSEVGFENNLSVTGAGFSAQIGAIAKITEAFRVGITYDTPTWYEISEETTQYLETERTVDEQSLLAVVDPRVLNIFADYRLRTPGKVAASAAYIFGKHGLISFDYGYKDYSQIKFSPSNDPGFAAQNSLISSALKGASSYRAGAEYRINQISLRGGVHYEESPYVNEATVGDLSGFSLGLGYNFGHYNFDISYSRSEQSRNQQLYAIGLTNSANIDTTLNNIIFTLGISI